MRYCRFSTGSVQAALAHWRASVVQQEPGSDERWNVHIYCAFRTPPNYGGYDFAYVLHAGGEPYSAPLADAIHRAERWYWKGVLGRCLTHGPGNAQPEFEQANGIPDQDDPLAHSGAVLVFGVDQYPDRSQRSAFHATPTIVRDGQPMTASVARDRDTQEWGVWLSCGEPGWLQAGGVPYRAPATVSAQRAERWYWQTALDMPLPRSEDNPQPSWEQDNHIPDLDDPIRLPQLV